MTDAMENAIRAGRGRRGRQRQPTPEPALPPPAPIAQGVRSPEGCAFLYPGAPADADGGLREMFYALKGR